MADNPQAAEHPCAGVARALPGSALLSAGQRFPLHRSQSFRFGVSFLNPTEVQRVNLRKPVIQWRICHEMTASVEQSRSPKCQRDVGLEMGTASSNYIQLYHGNA